MTPEVKYINHFFQGLEFDEPTHRYSLNGVSIPVSVSGIVNKFKKPFPFEEKSRKKALEEGVTQQEIKDRWTNKKNKACELGTRVHLFGEKYTFDRNIVAQDGYEEAIVKFWDCLPSHIVPVMVEVRMYHKKYRFAGTCDTLLYNTHTGKHILTDYKTNEDLFKNFAGERLLHCFSDLLKNDFNCYQIQLSLYQLLFEQTGLQIEDRRIIHLNPNGDFKLYQTEDYTDRLLYYLENQ